MKKEEVLYSETHEWAHLNGSIVTVGLSEFAIESIGDLVHIELPQVGRTIAANEPFGEIESITAVSDIFSPVTGEIVEVNAGLEDEIKSSCPSALLADPLSSGWLVRIYIKNPYEYNLLMNWEKYNKICNSLRGIFKE